MKKSGYTFLIATLACSQSVFAQSIRPTSEQVDHVRLNTTHGKIETAGVPFGFSIGVYDSKDNLMTGYTGTHATSWIVQTKTSVDGTAPSNLPTNFVCTFVNGICQLNSETVLVNPTTDSPVDRTLVSVGIDGDSVGAIYNDEIIVRDAE